MNNKRMNFTGLKRDMISGAKYAILPGDPKRAEALAKYLDPCYIPVTSNRQYNSFLSDVSGNKVLVISTGMGCPATCVAVEELASLGLEHFVRVGTSGSIQDHIKLGEIVISRAAVKLDEASSQYAGMEYPAVASFGLTQSFIDGAKSERVPYHVGITVSADTFWPGQERYDNYSGYLLRKFKGSMEEWKALNVTNFEMEASALFTLSSAFNLDAACFCGIIATRSDSEEVDIEAKKIALDNCTKVMKQGLILDIEKRDRK